ncbi:MAG: BMP family ABC transporter substrate-binding protein [Fervidicoccaceae archaeon]
MRTVSTAIVGAIVVIVIAVAILGIYLAERGGAPSATTTVPATTTSPPKTTTNLSRNSICIVYDVGGRGDLSFNDMAYLGASRAAKDFGLKLVEAQSTSQNDYLPNLNTMAQSGSCLVIVAVGFLMADAVNQTAAQYPNQNFAIIDAVVPQPNVLSVTFKEEEGSALAGALAAMIAHYYNYSSVGVVLGMEIPVLYKFEAGYYWGIRYGEQLYQQYTGQNVTPLNVLWTYTGSFNDPAKGKTATQAQLAQGAGIVYNVAGATGLGIFDAVEEYNMQRGRTMGPPFAIGVDSDQDWIKPGYIIASVEKRVDIGVYDAVQRALSFYSGNISKYGGQLVLGLNEGGVALSSLDDLNTFLQIAVQAGKTVNQTQIFQKVGSMRNSIPQWIWQAVANLTNTLKVNQNISAYGLKFSDIESLIVNNALDSAKIKDIRAKLGVPTG